MSEFDVDKIKPRPCPFCGEAPNIYSGGIFGDVWCMCAAKPRMVVCGELGEPKEQILERAIEKWNHRPGSGFVIGFRVGLEAAAAKIREAGEPIDKEYLAQRVEKIPHKPE